MAEAIKTFVYTAQDSQEIVRSGEYNAIDQSGVISYLSGMGLTPINIKQKKKSVLDIDISFFDTVPPNEIYNFTRQLAVMLRAGVPLIDALEAMESDQNNPGLNRVIKSVVQSISSGVSSKTLPLLSFNAYFVSQTFAANSSPPKYSFSFPNFNSRL